MGEKSNGKFQINWLLITMSIKRTLKSCLQNVTIAGLFVLKFPLQLAGGRKRPEVFIDSLEKNNRFSVYLSIALASEYLIEIRIKDLPYFYRYLPFRDFLFKCVMLFPGKNPVAPLVLSRESEKFLPWKQPIWIDGDYYSARNRAVAHLIMPYFAHPTFYRKRLHLKSPAFRPGFRPFKIFFCGTLDKQSYARSFRFPILNRHQIMEYIFQHFPDHIANSMEGPRKAITILTTDDTRDVVEKHPFSPVRYFQALSKADFFIAPPGWVMPHCHNIIEAMTAGTIPITNYAQHFDPPLQNGTNCLSFASYEDLDVALRQAMQMPADRVDFLRRGTLDYYQRYLKPSSFGANFRRCWTPSMHLIVNQERADYAQS